MTIKVRNWDRWQSYRKDRGQPPWIKLWRCLLRNPDFLLLTDAQRGQLLCLWLLAADHNGTINMTVEEIARVCGMSSPLDLKLFKDRGFLDFGVTVASRRRHDDATVASLWRHGDASESESESETEKNPRKKTARPASLAARGIADDIAAMVNERHRTKRAATATLIRAVEILLLAGHGAEDILLVVRHRLKNEDWFHPNRYGAESLIRRDKFPSALQIAKESKPRPITSTSIDEGGWEY